MFVDQQVLRIGSPPEKLVLPNMQVPLPEGEASQWIAQSALQVREIEVMSTIGVTLGEDSLKSNVGNLAQSPSSPSHSIEEPAESAIWESLSPLVNHGHPEFYCAIFQSSFNEDCHNPSNTKQFYRLHRYSHLATTSLVRQLFAFGVHVPVIGVLLSGSRIAFHVDWATAIDGRVVCCSIHFRVLDGLTLSLGCLLCSVYARRGGGGFQAMGSLPTRRCLGGGSYPEQSQTLRVRGVQVRCHSWAIEFLVAHIPRRLQTLALGRQDDG